MSARVHAFERFTTENTKHHEGRRRANMLTHRDLSNRIIGLAIEVHRNVGPGLLESVYAECLSDELGQADIRFQRGGHGPGHLQRQDPPARLSRGYPRWQYHP